MKCPVHLQTKQGLEQWEALLSQQEMAKQNDLLQWFKSYAQSQAMKMEIEIIHFLEKTENEIDDSPELMVQWKQMADRQSLFAYFAR